MDWTFDGFLISTNKDMLQLGEIHRFLSTHAYWCRGIPKDILSKAIDESLCFGLYTYPEKIQIGFARVVTDKATFAWLCDVYIEPQYRRHGLSKRLIECVTSHPDLKNLRRFCLATKDAHSLYEKFGFQKTQTPENWMEIKGNELYKEMEAELDFQRDGERLLASAIQSNLEMSYESRIEAHEKARQLTEDLRAAGKNLDAARS